jgi:hypothetical protein
MNKHHLRNSLTRKNDLIMNGQVKAKVEELALDQIFRAINPKINTLNFINKAMGNH